MRVDPGPTDLRLEGTQKYYETRDCGFCALVIAWGLAGVAAAGPKSVDARLTGTFQLVLGGESRTFHAYAKEIPENAGEGVENEAAREQLEAIAGTTQHTATWNAPEPLVVNGVVISEPTAMFVFIGARPTEDANAGDGELVIEFALTLDTLALADPERYEVSLKFYPENYGVTDYYALTEGGLEITSVERIDEFTLRVQGSLEGVLSFQTSMGVVAHNPDDVIEVSGTFDLLEVVGGR